MTTVVPDVPELPPAPQRQMSSSTYPVVADTWAAAINPWTLKVNIFGTWMGQQIDGIAISKQAAQQAAAAAADSASAANGSKNAAAQSAIDATNNGSYQVGLAAQQVTLANSARESAQVAAAAAQASAGLPSLAGNAYKVLRVTPNGLAVEWGLGLPALPSVGGAPGKVLNINSNGTSLAWVETDKVGDIITCARNPGSLWLPADGSIRAQSSYPTLFAALGLIGISIGTVWTSVNLPITSNASSKVVSSANGTTIVMNSAGVVSRSLDKGLTWGAGIATGIVGTIVSLATNGAGIWVATTSNTNGAGLRSLDDGLTWSAITMPATTAGGYRKVVFAGGSTFVAITGTGIAATFVAVSTNNGASWTTIAHGAGSVAAQDIASDEAGVVVMSTTATLRRSGDYGQTWVALPAPASAIQAIATDKRGTWLISGANGNTNTYLSTNNAQGFSLTPMGTTLAVVDITAMDGAFFMVINGGTTEYVYSGGLFTPITVPVGMYSPIHVGNNILLVAGGANNVSRGLPYAYDTTTQFQLPAMPVVSGIKSYIKALEAAA